jgi:hypothetical protein
MMIISDLPLKNIVRKRNIKFYYLINDSGGKYIDSSIVEKKKPRKSLYCIHAVFLRGRGNIIEARH